jgi:EAL domain-containing protein (putative c-di-GMP-specific phosphodiesterase class I)
VTKAKGAPAQLRLGALVRPLMAASRQHLNVDLAALVSITDESLTLLSGAGDVSLLAPNSRLSEWSKSFVSAAGPATARVPDGFLDGGWGMVQPLLRPSDGAMALVLAGRGSGLQLTPGLSRYLGALGVVLGDHLGLAGAAENGERGGAEIASIVAAGGPEMVGQPIVQLKDRATVGFEALARFPGYRNLTPGAWFALAEEVGLGARLELAAVKNALSHIDALPIGAFLTVNISAAAAVEGSFLAAAANLSLKRVILEIPDRGPGDEFPQLKRSLHHLRTAGLRVALDNAVPSVASMQHIVDLEPDLIKLDGSWTGDVQSDGGRRVLISALAAFAAERQIPLVGQAVETAPQAAILGELGCELGQGFFFGRPEPFGAPR